MGNVTTSFARVNIELLPGLFQQTKINLWPGPGHKSPDVVLGKNIYGKIQAIGDIKPGVFDRQ